ncbi:MAG: phage holin [Lachnospiraceae bacterium]
MINWKVRIKNKTFWLSLIPALLLLAQALGAVFGLSLDLSAVGEKLLTVVNTLFAVLTILGVVTDPTTAGVSDSKLALSYDEPRKLRNSAAFPGGQPGKGGKRRDNGKRYIFRAAMSIMDELSPRVARPRTVTRASTSSAPRPS